MVSIMRPEQTLRLIQLYHANYPEIARNNQDADGRNLKLKMWAQITEELNGAFETQFTVEQFKKKVQNVQCTSRQKLYSGKRNLGEAEVEYLRLFESDKITEEVLTLRAKNRSHSGCSSNPKSASTASASPTHGVDFFAIGREKRESEGSENSGAILEVKMEAEMGEGEEAEMGAALMLGNGTTMDGEGGNGTAIGAAECQHQQQEHPLDTAQQFLLAMLNVTLNGGMPMLEEGAGGVGHLALENGGEIIGKKRKSESIFGGIEDENRPTGNGNGQPPAAKRSRKPERPTRSAVAIPMEEMGRGESKGTEEGEKMMVERRNEEKEEGKMDGEKTLELPSAAEEKPASNGPMEAEMPMGTSIEGKIENPMPPIEEAPIDQTTSMPNGNEPETSDEINSQENEQIAPENAASELATSSGPIPPPKCECQCHRRDGQEGDSSLDALCTQLEKTNQILTKIAEIIAQRLPMPPPLNGNGNGGEETMK